jgi:hypothetical protein
VLLSIWSILVPAQSYIIWDTSVWYVIPCMVFCQFRMVIKRANCKECYVLGCKADVSTVGLEMGPLSLVSTIEELLERKNSGFGLENQDYGRRDPSHWPLRTLYLQKLALTSLTSGGRSVGIVRSRTQDTEFSLVQKNIQVHHHGWKDSNSGQ